VISEERTTPVGLDERMVARLTALPPGTESVRIEPQTLNRWRVSSGAIRERARARRSGDHERATMGEVRLGLEQRPAGWIAELAARLSALGELVPCPVDVAELIRGVPNVGRVNVKRLPTDGASQVRIVLEPSEAVLGLLTALRARDGDGQFIG
jgi:hypothetical protein